MERFVKRVVQGMAAVDGAGVRLVRVLGLRTVKDFDPFLMLDSFDSRNPSDYLAGFPMHPHRGIETITYLIEGEMIHEDSLGNRGVIRSGGTQWMTAGSGILHQEMPQASPRMLGLQLWLNLPQAEKMTSPKYFDITREFVPEVTIPGGSLRVISGSFQGTEGAKTHHLPAALWDVSLRAGGDVDLPTDPSATVFAFLFTGTAEIDQVSYAEKSAILFGEGDSVRIKAPQDQPLRFLLAQARPLREPVVWGGPIVMNTQSELDLAFRELRSGTFLRH